MAANIRCVCLADSTGDWKFGLLRPGSRSGLVEAEITLGWKFTAAVSCGPQSSAVASRQGTQCPLSLVLPRRRASGDLWRAGPIPDQGNHTVHHGFGSSGITVGQEKPPPYEGPGKAAAKERKRLRGLVKAGVVYNLNQWQAWRGFEIPAAAAVCQCRCHCPYRYDDYPTAAKENCRPGHRPGHRYSSLIEGLYTLLKPYRSPKSPKLPTCSFL